MAVNRGKDFESNVHTDIERLGNVYIQRLYDTQGGQLGVANPCDFIAYKYPHFYMIECKSTHDNTLSIHSNDPKRKYGAISNKQWEGLLKASQYGVVAGVLCWWIDKDVTKFLPIQDLVEYKNSGAKSVRYDYELNNSIIINGTKKRVYFEYDFTDFFNQF